MPRKQREADSKVKHMTIYVDDETRQEMIRLAKLMECLDKDGNPKYSALIRKIFTLSRVVE